MHLTQEFKTKVNNQLESKFENAYDEYKEGNGLYLELDVDDCQIEIEGTFKNDSFDLSHVTIDNDLVIEWRDDKHSVFYDDIENLLIGLTEEMIDQQDTYETDYEKENLR